jgi:hypothetical protein
VEGSDSDLFQGIIRPSLGGPEENHENPSGEILTGSLRIVSEAY